MNIKDKFHMWIWIMILVVGGMTSPLWQNLIKWPRDHEDTPDKAS